MLVILAGAAVGIGCWSADSVGDRTDSPTPASASPTVSAKSSVSPSPTATSMDNTNKTKAGGIKANLPAGFQIPTDEVGSRMFREYGAMFVARSVTPPPVIGFRDESEVVSFQNGLSRSTETIGGKTIELQAPAMEALKKAIADAKANNLSITPRGDDPARRSYEQTVKNWLSRVEPGLKAWTSAGKITAEEAARIKALSPVDQVPEIFKLEAKGIYFSADRSKSIIYSVAPPGMSQHISMLALDVEQFGKPEVRRILADNGWFQTVASDMPHFTYLGVKESELPGLGLKKVETGGQTFWVPDV